MTRLPARLWKLEPKLVVLVGLSLLLGTMRIGSAQYGSSYPYPRQPATSPRLPSSGQHFGGVVANPFRNDGIPPAGLPVSGNKPFSYYGSSRSGGSNPFGHQAGAKPFSNLHRPQPLVTAREAAQIEVARGLWW